VKYTHCRGCNRDLRQWEPHEFSQVGADWDGLCNGKGGCLQKFTDSKFADERQPKWYPDDSAEHTVLIDMWLETHSR